MSMVDLPAPRVDFIDARTGKVAREWTIFFQQVFTRIGGSSADSIAAISASIVAILASIADREVEIAFESDTHHAQEDDIKSHFVNIPIIIPDQQEPNDYNARIAEILKQVDSLRNEIAMLPDSTAGLGEVNKTIKTYGTMATQAAGSVAITGGAISGTTFNNGAIGATTPSTGKFTSMEVSAGGSTTISTGVGSVKMSSANAATNTAWIPIKYAGTTYFVPGWTTNSP